MTVEQRRKIAEDLFISEIKIMETKGADYSGTKDTLKNFKQNAEILGITKYQVWLVYFMKHIDAITNSIKRNPNEPEAKSEPLSDRILDGRVYLTLLKCLLEEDGEIKNEKDKKLSPILNQKI